MVGKILWKTVYVFLLVLTLARVLVCGQHSGDSVTKYLAYEPYWGWSNQLEELKTMATFAKLTKRTLVLPRFALGREYKSSNESYQLNVRDCDYGYEDYKGYCTDFATLIDVERLREFIPVILEKDFLKMNANSKRLSDIPRIYTVNYGVDFSNKTVRMSNRIRWVDEHRNYYAKDSAQAPDKTTWCHTGELTGGVCERSIYELTNSDSLTYFFPEYHSFAVARIRSRSRGKQYGYDNNIARFIAPSKEVREAAEVIRTKLSVDYYAVHIRRGDFLTEEWASKFLVDIEEFTISLMRDPEVGGNDLRSVYIATDEVDPMKLIQLQLLNSSSLPDYFTIPSLNFTLKTGQLFRSYVDQQICIGALEFVPQRGSTFSRYIQTVRDKQWNMESHGYSLDRFNAQKRVEKERKKKEKELQEEAQKVKDKRVHRQMTDL